MTFRDPSAEHTITIARLAGELAAEAGAPFVAELTPGLGGPMLVRFSRGIERASPGDDTRAAVYYVERTSVVRLCERWAEYVTTERERMSAEQEATAHERSSKKQKRPKPRNDDCAETA